MSDCEHNGLYWYPAPHDEAGWKCVDCDWRPGEPPGYSPAHDRSHTYIKCWSLLNDLADAKILSVSNGSHGDSLAHAAARRCKRTGRYDQESIVAILAKLCAGDGKYWREVGEGIVAGKDPRNRCACGALSNVSSGNGSGGWIYRCMKCWSESSPLEPF